MMPVCLDRLGVLIGGQDHAVPSRLQPEAQAAATAEKICGQMRAFGSEASRVGQERFLIRARLRVGGQTDERAPDELDAVVPTQGRRCPVPHVPSSLNAPAA